jgi:hypothetical protein
MNLFADLYLDEDVSVLVATLLRARGFNVTTTRDQEMLGQPDQQQLTRATELRRCIITHNRVDYEQLHREYLARGKKHFGIIVGARRDAYELTRRVAKLLDTVASDEIENQLYYI